MRIVVKRRNLSHADHISSRHAYRDDPVGDCPNENTDEESLGRVERLKFTCNKGTYKRSHEQNEREEPPKVSTMPRLSEHSDKEETDR